MAPVVHKLRKTRIDALMRRCFGHPQPITCGVLSECRPRYRVTPFGNAVTTAGPCGPCVAKLGICIDVAAAVGGGRFGIFAIDGAKAAVGGAALELLPTATATAER